MLKAISALSSVGLMSAGGCNTSNGLLEYASHETIEKALAQK